MGRPTNTPQAILMILELSYFRTNRAYGSLTKHLTQQYTTISSEKGQITAFS